MLGLGVAFYPHPFLFKFRNASLLYHKYALNVPASFQYSVWPKRFLELYPEKYQ